MVKKSFVEEVTFKENDLLQQNCIIKNMPPEVLSFVRKFHSLTKFIHEEKCGTVTK